jgi:hypothetical protein
MWKTSMGASTLPGPDEEVNVYINQLISSVGTYLYGRRMYEAMVYWEILLRLNTLCWSVLLWPVLLKHTLSRAGGGACCWWAGGFGRMSQPNEEIVVGRGEVSRRG